MTLVYTEYFSRIDDAFRREKPVQGWSRAKRRALITEEAEPLPALSRKPSAGESAGPDPHVESVSLDG